MEPPEKVIATEGSTGSAGPKGTRELSQMDAAFAPPPEPEKISLLAPPMTNPAPEFSVITCSPAGRNDAKFAQVSNVYHQVLAGEEYEIIRIPDAKSMAEGYNRGAKLARGRVLVFSHDDAAPVRPIAARLRSHLRRADIVAGAGSDRLDGPAWFTSGPPYVFGQVLNNVPTQVRIQHPDGKIEEKTQKPFMLSVYGVPSRHVSGIQTFDGFWFACHRSVLDVVRFDEETCDSFHMYDVDFSYRAYRAGLKIGVATDLYLMHASIGGYSDPKWKPAADKWLAKYGQMLRPHRSLDFQSAAVAGEDLNQMVAVMETFVARTEE